MSGNLSQTGIAGKLLELSLLRMGLAVESAGSIGEAKRLLDDETFDLCLTDMRLPDGEGMELVRHISANCADLPVAVITAYGSTENAVAALKCGAFDYLTKPLDPNKLQRLLERLAEINAQKRENRALRRQLNDRGRFGRIIGHSPSMRALYQVLEQAAPTPASMLILGRSEEHTSELRHMSESRMPSSA